MRFSASSSEKSTKLSAVLRRFSRISTRFSVSSAAFSWINSLNWDVAVKAATCGGLLAEPVICEKIALFAPCNSHVWCALMWLRKSIAKLVFGGEAIIMLFTPSFRVGRSAFMIASWKLYSALGSLRSPLRGMVCWCLATWLKTCHSTALSCSIPTRTATG